MPSTSCWLLGASQRGCAPALRVPREDASDAAKGCKKVLQEEVQKGVHEAEHEDMQGAAKGLHTKHCIEDTARGLRYWKRQLTQGAKGGTRGVAPAAVAARSLALEGLKMSKMRYIMSGTKAGPPSCSPGDCTIMTYKAWGSLKPAHHELNSSTTMNKLSLLWSVMF